MENSTSFHFYFEARNAYVERPFASHNLSRIDKGEGEGKLHLGIFGGVVPPGSPNSECVKTDQNASFSNTRFPWSRLFMFSVSLLVNICPLLPFGVGGGWLPTKAIMGISIPTPTPRALYMKLSCMGIICNFYSCTLLNQHTT